MASSMRIVLVDPLGEVLFSGESMVARQSADIEPCPETKRSAESGVYRAVDASADVADGTETFDPDAEIRTTRRGPRAA